MSRAEGKSAGDTGSGAGESKGGQSKGSRDRGSRDRGSWGGGGAGQKAAALLLLAGLALLAATYAGSWHAAGDSLAVGRPYLAVLLVALGLLWRGGAGWLAAGAGALALAPILWDAMPRPPVQGLRVYQQNLRFDLADPSRVIADIRATNADIALLQEVSDHNLTIPQALADQLPHQSICPAYGVGAVAVLSRWPLSHGRCLEGQGAVWARVETPEGPISVVSLHLYWPWPAGPFAQTMQVDEMLPRMWGLPRPILVGGDFNAVPGSQVVQKIAAVTGTERAGPLRPSFFLKGVLPVTIDHVLTPRKLRVRSEMRPDIGSDHRGQLVTLEMTPWR